MVLASPLAGSQQGWDFGEGARVLMLSVVGVSWRFLPRLGGLLAPLPQLARVQALVLEPPGIGGFWGFCCCH